MRINFLRSKAMSAGACNPNPRDYCSNTSPKRSTAHSVRPCQRNDSAKAPNPTIERDARKSGARPSLRTSYGTSHSSGDQVRKLTKCSVLCAVAHLLFGCAGNQPSSVPQLGNVPIGASLAKGQLQEIELPVSSCAELLPNPIPGGKTLAIVGIRRSRLGRKRSRWTQNLYARGSALLRE